MNKRSIIRGVATGVVILAVNMSVQAQLGGALNRARQAAEQATQGATGNAPATGNPVGEAVSERAAETAATATLPPEIRTAIAKLQDESKRSAPAVKGLSDGEWRDWFNGGIFQHSEADVKTLKAAMEARTKENLEILCALYEYPAGYDCRNFFNDYELDRSGTAKRKDKTGDEIKMKESVKADHSGIDSELLKELRSYASFMFNLKGLIFDLTLDPQKTRVVTQQATGNRFPVAFFQNERTDEIKVGADVGAVYQVFKASNGLTAPMTQELYDRRLKDITYANILFYQDWAKDQPDEYLTVKLALEKLPEIQANSAKLQQKAPMPTARMNDAALNTQMVQAAKYAYPEWDIVRILITDADWLIERDAFGQIVRRRINAAVIRKEGTGHTMVTINFAQDYAAGNYGTAYRHAIGMDQMAVDYK
jgi:hypothetical protein